jgi:hypothetical protein
MSGHCSHAVATLAALGIMQGNPIFSKNLNGYNRFTTANMRALIKEGYTLTIFHLAFINIC